MKPSEKRTLRTLLLPPIGHYRTMFSATRAALIEFFARVCGLPLLVIR